MRNLILYLLPLLLVFASCKKGDDGDTPDKKQAACYIKSYKQVGSTYHTYEYDGNNNLNRVNHEGSSGSTGYTKYEWKNGLNTTMTEYNVSGESQAYYEFKYDGGELKSVILNQYVPQAGTFGQVERDTAVSENGLIKEYYRYKILGSDWKLNSYSKYEYDGNGNLVKITNYDSQKAVTGTNEIDVDPSKTSQYRYYKTALTLSSKNLRTEMRIYGATGSLTNTVKYTIAQENADGYPADLTISSGSASQQELYTYDCK